MSLVAARNIAIIAVIALGVAFLPRGGDIAEAVFALIGMAFLAAITYAIYIASRQNRLTLLALPGLAPLRSLQRFGPDRAAGSRTVEDVLHRARYFRLADAARLCPDRYLAGLVGGESLLNWRLVSWNLFHGRDFPPEPKPGGLGWRVLGRPITGRDYALLNRDLFYEFAALLSAAKWDAALLQEVPPRWADRLARATGSESRVSLTARNWMRPLTGPVARLRPHLTGSWEGGCNLVLIRKGRPGTTIVEHRRAVLARWPERRVLSMVKTGYGLCLANFHASTGPGAAADVIEAARLSLEWADAAPLVLGGDFNLRPRSSPAFDRLESEYGLTGATGSDSIDHLLVRGPEVLDPATAWPEIRRVVPDPGTGLKLRLSDHAPVVSRISA